VAYLLFLPLAVLLILMTYVFLQNRHGRPNHVFALYMLDLSVAACALLVHSTTPNAALASSSAILVIVTIFTINSTFLVALTLTLFYPHALMRWYAAPLFIVFGVALSLGLVCDGLFNTQWFYAPTVTLGQGYVPLQELILGGRVGFLLFVWLFLCVLVSVVLQIVAWFRTRPGERGVLTLLIVSLIVGSAASALLPPGPLSAQLPVMLFPIVFGITVARYRYLLVGGTRVLMPAQVALDTVFGSASDGMVICNQSGHVEQVNEVAEQLTGIRAEQAIGLPLAEAFAGLAQQAGQEAKETPLARAFAAGELEPFDVVLRLAEPTPRVLAVTGNPIRDRRSAVLGYFLTLRDVTERQRAQEALEAQARLAETVRELSAPIIPVMEGILILPVIGAIDSERAQIIMDDMLVAIRRERARAILIDITGVPVVDTLVASHLLQAVQAARLLGCQGILVGIRAEVAQTMVDLGLDMRGLLTKGSLQDGLAYAVEALKATGGLRRG
jgi:rsbT co-antagonist protein RsbR